MKRKTKRRLGRGAKSRAATAFHEAAHAVARLHAGRRIAPGERPKQRAWDGLLCSLAGPYAEGLISRRPLEQVLRTRGRDDLEDTIHAMAWLVSRGHAVSPRSVYERAHVITLGFLMMRWEAITRVASALHVRGRLTARQVRALARVPGT